MTTLYHFPRSLSSGAVQVVLELEAPVTIRQLGFKEGQFTCDDEAKLALPTGGMGLIGPVRSCPTYRETAEGGELTLVQCSAIMERLCDRFDEENRLRPPPGTPERARHLSLMVFAEATFFPIVQFLSPEDSPNNNDREAMRRERFKGLVAPFLLDQLGDQQYLCGDTVSACDFITGMPCLNNAFNAGVLEDIPKLMAYYDRLRSRESFAEARGDIEDEVLNGALGDMVATAHQNRWDFTFRHPHER